MRIGVVKETKQAERRVAVTDVGVAALVADGHDVLVEAGAGDGAGVSDSDYERAGGKVVPVEEAWHVDLVVKVKEPVGSEYPFLSESTALFTFLHLAADRPLTQALLDSRVTAIAYETVEDDRRSLPLLTPMSEIAGRLAAHAAGQYLQHPFGGPGTLLGGSPGVAPARMVVVGGGVVGTQAALLAVGMGAEVTLLDTSPTRIRQLHELFGSSARVLQADPVTTVAQIEAADVVVGAVLLPGASAPTVVTRDVLGRMRPDALLIDVAIDQGGCFETSRPTTYADPTYVVDGVVHYCVANMPGAVPHTSTRALTNATLPHVRNLAARGVDGALRADAGLARGLNTRDGLLLHPGVAAAFPDLPTQIRRSTDASGG